MPLPLSVLCGQLLVAGFAGATLPSSFRAALAGGRVGGAILFRRNIPLDDSGLVRLDALAALNAELRGAASNNVPPPVIAVDQEGGRVARLGAPLLRLPPARFLARFGEDVVEEVAAAQGAELRALGFTMNFAPVLDVHTREDNPVIGDRAFGETADHAARSGLAFARGLARAGILACGKHFPGHGDTTKDSHFDLPVVDQPRARLDAVEFEPFRSAARAGVPALMTAHVRYPALDEHPATLSRRIATELLRDTLGFRGVLFSDDLEMKAIADRYGVEEAAVLALGAGCDVLLYATDGPLDRVHEAVVRRAEVDSVFRARCEDAAARVLAMRATVAPPGIAKPETIVGGPASRRVAQTLAAALEGRK